MHLKWFKIKNKNNLIKSINKIILNNFKMTKLEVHPKWSKTKITKLEVHLKWFKIKITL